MTIINFVKTKVVKKRTLWSQKKINWNINVDKITISKLIENKN